LTVLGFDPATGTTMDEKRRLAVRIAAFLEVNTMQIGHLKMTRSIRLNRRIGGWLAMHRGRVRSPRTAVNGAR
jgi:hypothetical protein